jgi:hypothetical protein
LIRVFPHPTDRLDLVVPSGRHHIDIFGYIQIINPVGCNWPSLIAGEEWTEESRKGLTRPSMILIILIVESQECGCR